MGFAGRSVTDRLEKQIGRTLGNLPAVFSSFFDRDAEMVANEDARQRVFIRRVGEARVRAHYRGGVSARASCGQREAAGVETDVVGTEELFQRLCRGTTLNRVP